MNAVCAHCTAARESSERAMMRIEERQSWECYELNARNHVRLVSLVGAQYSRAIKLLQNCLGSQYCSISLYFSVLQVRLAKEKTTQQIEEKVVRAKEELSMHEEGLTFLNGVATSYSRWKPSPELRATLHAHKDEVRSTTVIPVMSYLSSGACTAMPF
jgi:hypothetical protein